MTFMHRLCMHVCLSLIVAQKFYWLFALRVIFSSVAGFFFFFFFFFFFCFVLVLQIERKKSRAF